MACLLVCRRNCGLAEKYNTVLTDCGMPTVRRWLPQALALPSFIFATFLSNGERLWCGAERCGALLPNTYVLMEWKPRNIIIMYDHAEQCD